MLSGRWNDFDPDSLEAFRLPLVGGSGRGRGRVLGLVLGNNDRMRKALEANYRPPVRPVGGGLQLNWRQRKRARALTTEKGESYEGDH